MGVDDLLAEISRYLTWEIFTTDEQVRMPTPGRAHLPLRDAPADSLAFRPEDRKPRFVTISTQSEVVGPPAG